MDQNDSTQQYQSPTPNRWGESRPGHGADHRDLIKSTGYVAHSFEAALWCVGRTANFRNAVLLAANLGDDADTTAAITGQLAGAIYGLQGIPANWLAKLAWAERIEWMGRALISGSTIEPAR